jgi:chromosome segregation ATPase
VLQNDKDGEIRDLQQQLQSGEKTMDELKSRVVALQTQLESSKQQNAHDLQLLESSLDLMRSEAKQAKQQLERSRLSEQESTAEVERLQTELTQLLEQKKSAEMKMQTEVENLRIELTRQTQQTKQAEAAAKVEIERLTTELAQWQHDNEMLRTNHSREIDKIKNDSDENKQKLEREGATELARANENVQRYRKEIEALKQKLHDKEQNSEETRKIHASQLETMRLETENLEKQHKTERMNEIVSLLSDCSRELSQLESFGQQSESSDYSHVCSRFHRVFKTAAH